jgi:hypothetical protein
MWCSPLSIFLYLVLSLPLTIPFLAIWKNPDNKLKTQYLAFGFFPWVLTGIALLMFTLFFGKFWFFC